MAALRYVWTHFWLLFAVISRCSSLYQPHIVFCMVDDMGWNDVSFHGSDQIQTPNIDSLAYQGVILQQYYSEAVCTPARTALLTGKYPMRLGMQGFPLYNSEDRGIPVTERLLPSYLKELGYATHLVGKWHVGQSREEYLPTARGYDTHYGMRGGFIDYYTYNKVENWPNGRLLYGLDLFDEDIPQVQEDRYIVDALTDRAINVIERHNTSQPLFLHLTHNAPHSGNAGGALQPPLNSTVKNNHIAHSDRRLYAEVVSHLDKSIGRVIKALADKQILDETIIIFQSDNGAPTTGDLANLGVNLPFRGKKYTPWEGGVRVPAVIWHSSFKPSVWQGLMHITDWLPTLISAAGGQVTNKIDGINQWESIIQKSASKRTEVLVAVEDFYSNYAAYRAGDYKIIVGNVTGVSNGYYGEEFMANRNDPPPYFPVLKSCDTAKAFESLGIYLDVDEVKALRSSATIKQYDPIRDNTPCVPTPSKGCLYNVRRDPTESHDLWQRASKIAALLTNRLRSLLTSQLRRGPPKLDALADPALYDYIWLPWINRNEELTNNYLNELGRALESSPNATAQYITLASLVECNGTAGFTNFLCLLKTAF